MYNCGLNILSFFNAFDYWLLYKKLHRQISEALKIKYFQIIFKVVCLILWKMFYQK